MEVLRRGRAAQPRDTADDSAAYRLTHRGAPRTKGDGPISLTRRATVRSSAVLAAHDVAGRCAGVLQAALQTTALQTTPTGLQTMTAGLQTTTAGQHTTRLSPVHGAADGAPMRHRKVPPPMFFPIPAYVLPDSRRCSSRFPPMALHGAANVPHIAQTAWCVRA